MCKDKVRRAGRRVARTLATGSVRVQRERVRCWRDAAWRVRIEVVKDVWNDRRVG